MILALCCNDYRNGNFTGILQTLELEYKGEHLIRLEVDCRMSVNYVIWQNNQQGVRISRRAFPIRAQQSWYGNWCWDAVDVSPKTALQIINYIRQKCHIEEGIQNLWEAFRADRDITLDDLRKAVA